MRPKPFKFDNHEINNGTTYEAQFVGDIFFRQAEGKSALLKRADNTPARGSKDRQAKTLNLRIISRSSVTDFSDAYDELNKWFDTYEDDEKTLIVKDESDSDRQWYVKVTVENTPRVMPDGFVVELLAADPIWRTVTENGETWNITASAQTNVFTILGNRPAKPIIKLKPTSAKVGGYAERIFRCWYNPQTDAPFDNFPLDVTGNAWNTTGLVADASVSNQINVGGGISAAATSFAVDTPVGGGLNTSGGVLTVDSEQIKYDDIVANVVNVSSGGRGWGGTTAATHADNAVCKKAHMLANGADIQVYVGKKRVSRWLSGVNTSTTQVWIAADFGVGIKLELGEAIASSGAVTSFKVRPTSAAVAALAELERKGTFKFVIGSECWTGTAVDRIKFEITGTLRAQFTSSMVAHSIGDSIYYFPDEIWVCWGDLSVIGTSGDTSSSQDETRQPMIDMDNSTNTSWRYLTFWDDDGLRAGGWKREVKAGRNCRIVGGSHGTVTDPSTEIGLLGQNYEINGSPRPNSYDLRVTLYHPAGFTNITCNGDKYRYSTDFAKVAGLWAGDSLITAMTSVFNISTPTAVKTWQSWTQTGVAIGKKYIQWRLYGNISQVEDNKHILEVQTITTLTIPSANNLTLAFSGATQSVYEFGREANNTPLRIENTTNGEYFNVSFIGELDEELKIDCNAEKVTYLKDNTRADDAISYPPRDHILQFDPGTDGNNTLKLTDAGTAGMTMTVSWEDRNT